MSNKLVGIRYIGLKDLQEDTVNNSGATWVKDQVNNFSENLANELLVHTDSFELADVDADADTFMGKKSANNVVEPVAFTNLNAMDAAQLATFARLQFNKIVNLEDGRSIAAVLSEVHAYMTNDNLDQEATNKRATTKGLILKKEVTKEEFQAVLAGTLALKLVPVFGVRTLPEAIITASDALLADDVVSTDIIKPAVESVISEEKPALSLTDLIASLDKPELIGFAKQEGVAVSNTMNVDQLRAKLLRDLANKTPAGL